MTKLKSFILFSAVSALLSFVAVGCSDKKGAGKEDGEGKTEAAADKSSDTALMKNALTQLRATDEAGTSEDATPEEQKEELSGEAQDEPVGQAPDKKPAVNPVYMGMWGNVGGTGFLFDMNGTEGSYIPYDIAEAKEYGARRQLKLVSYDPKSGRCVINAYLNGAYIGQFDGEFQEEECETDDGGSYAFQAYNGIFKSVKGAKLDFHFHFD